MEYHGDAPVLGVCRLLVARGFAATRSLEVFRGDSLAVRVGSIGVAATLRVASHGVGFERLSHCTPASLEPVEGVACTPTAASSKDALDEPPGSNSTLGLSSRTSQLENLRSHNRLAAQSNVYAPSAPLDVAREVRSIARHGLSGGEVNRIMGAVRFMERELKLDASLRNRRGRSRNIRLWWLSTSKDIGRAELSELRKRLARLQIAGSLPPYSISVFETRGGLHGHIVFIGDNSIVAKLRESAFAEWIKVDAVTDAHALATRYLVKERTPQAGYGRNHLLGGRIRGSHRIEGGGDRVRLSSSLAADAISAGFVKPWRRSNGRRKS